MSLHNRSTTVHGRWHPRDHAPRAGADAFFDAVHHLSRPLYVVEIDGTLGVAQDGTAELDVLGEPPGKSYPLVGWSPPLSLADLGDAGFRADHGLRYAYICGAMANGITSVAMVEAAGKAGMIGFFGAGGLSIAQIAEAVDHIKHRLDGRPFGFNLIHSPNDTDLEQRTVDLYLSKGVHLVSASAYLDLTDPLVEYRVHGIHRDRQGSIVCPNRIIAKVSREEVARKFFSPPPEKHLRRLVAAGRIDSAQAALARHVPMAQDLTAEADSGGHTDNRPAVCLLPTMQAVRAEMAARYNYPLPLRVGLAGGIATPEAAAAAFAMGAAYVLTGSINQSCVEADTSLLVKQMLTQARQADVIMAPAADMFEMGVKVQVLKRGTMFSMRGAKLFDIYRTFDRFEDVPDNQRRMVEESVLRCTFEQEWANTRAFFKQRDPSQIARADANPKHKMALVFRSYLGRASLWAKHGDPDRTIDYQIWCGPAMGAFNEWVNGSFLEPPENRNVVTVAMNLLYGAAVTLRWNALQQQGLRLPWAWSRPRPLADDQIHSRTR